MQKGKVPDYLPNKPVGIGSGESVPSGYFNKKPIGSGISNTGSVNLPNLSNPYVSSVAQNSAVGQNRNKSLPQYQGYKYGGIGGSGIGGGAADNNYGHNQNEQSI